MQLSVRPYFQSILHPANKSTCGLRNAFCLRIGQRTLKVNTIAGKRNINIQHIVLCQKKLPFDPKYANIFYPNVVKIRTIFSLNIGLRMEHGKTGHITHAHEEILY